MEYCLLGNTGYHVSRIGFGALTLSPICANLSVDAASRLINEAFDQGINFIDTAQHYRNYPHIAKAIYGKGDRIIVASRSFADSYEEMSYALEEARVGLSRNKLEIFMLHEIRDIEDFLSREEAWQCLLDAKANGIVGAIGISTHSADFAAYAANHPQIEVMQAMINIKGIGILDGDRSAMQNALALAHQNGKGVYGMKALGGGALMHEDKAALEWIFAQKYLDMTSIGIKDIAELLTDIGYLTGIEAKESAMVKKLDRNMVFDKEPRCHGCGRCVARCAQKALSLDNDNQVVWDKSLCLFCGYCIGECPWFCISFC